MIQLFSCQISQLKFNCDFIPLILCHTDKEGTYRLFLGGHRSPLFHVLVLACKVENPFLLSRYKFNDSLPLGSLNQITRLSFQLLFFSDLSWLLSKTTPNLLLFKLNQLPLLQNPDLSGKSSSSLPLPPELISDGHFSFPCSLPMFSSSVPLTFGLPSFGSVVRSPD